jgi:hypothetical protein
MRSHHPTQGPDATEVSESHGGRPLVSVILPTFNRPVSLAAAVESVLEQTYPRVEAIVVNDAGVDVEHELRALDAGQRLVYLRHDSNRGLAAARNTGIRAARGKYIAYLDDDDRFYPNHLETLVSFLELGTHSVAYTDAYRAHQTLVAGQYVTTLRDVPYSEDFDAGRMLEHNFVPVLCVVHAKSCLESVGIFDESLKRLEDWDLWIRMSRKFPFHHLPVVTCEFSWRTDGSTMTSQENGEFLAARQAITAAYGDFGRLKDDLAELKLIAGRAEQSRLQKERAEEMVAVLEGWLTCLRRCVEEGEVAIWGAGQGGLRAMHMLAAFGIRITRFVDSDPAKAGTTLEGIPVTAPGALFSGRRPFVLVASSAWRAIAEDLELRERRRGRDFEVVPPALLSPANLPWAAVGD